MSKIYDFAMIVLSIGLSFYKALVFMLMYNWFIATTFGIPVLSYWLSYALILTIGVLGMKSISISSMHYERKQISKEEQFAMKLGVFGGIALSLTGGLFIGWLIHLNI